MIKVWKENIWWGNTTFKKPSSLTHSSITSNEATTFNNANVIWQTYNRGTIQLDTPSGELYTYLFNVDENKYYFLYPSKTLSKSKTKIVYEVVPDVWVNEILRRHITGVLKLTSDEDYVIKNNNLKKPNKFILEQEIQRREELGIKFTGAKYITKFERGSTGDYLSGSGDSFLHWETDSITSDEAVGFRTYDVAYPLNKWLDGTQLPSKFNDYYVIGDQISGISSSRGYKIANDGDIILQDPIFWKKYNVSGKPVNNEFYINLNATFNPTDHQWMRDTIMTTEYDKQTELHISKGLMPLLYRDDGQVEIPLMIQWFVGDKKYDFTEGYSSIRSLSSFLTYAWKIDQPFNADFKYKLGEWEIPLRNRLTTGIDRQYYFLRANIWNLYTVKWDKGFKRESESESVVEDNRDTVEVFSVKDDEYFISADEKIIFYKGQWILHRSLIPALKEDNVITLNVDNDVNYSIQFRDGEVIDLPYGKNTLSYSLIHKENGSVLKYQINNTHSWRKGDYLQYDSSVIHKNVKVFKDDANLVDRQLKYSQLQLAQQENKFNQMKYEIEEKSRVGNFVGSVVGNVLGAATSVATLAGSALTGNVAGAVAGSTGIASSAQNIISSSVNFHYDSIIREEQFKLSQSQYAFKKQQMEREFEKLNPKNNIVNDWGEMLKHLNLGDDGFIIWEYRPSEESRYLYTIYKENVGLETNDPHWREVWLDKLGVYQFSEFIEWSPYNSEEIKHILNNPILVS